jgi:hypothetical protein
MQGLYNVVAGHGLVRLAGSWWLRLIYCERKILLAGWWLVLNWCERKALLAGWEPASRTRPMYMYSYNYIIPTTTEQVFDFFSSPPEEASHDGLLQKGIKAHAVV